MFQTARIKLTIWYMAITMLVSALFSVTIFGILQKQLAANEDRFMVRIDRLRQIDPNFEEHFEAHQEDVEMSQRRLIADLLYVNLLVLGLSAVAGYILAGRALKPIKEMVEKQKQFIADASHEFRTPLTALKTSIEVNLRNPSLTAGGAKKLLNENLQDVEKMRRLSDNLLSLAKMQTTSQEHVTQLSVQAILLKSIKTVAPLAREKHIQIIKTIEDSSLFGRKEQLTELFIIFLDNAIKYSPTRSSIKVTAKKKSSHVEITIKDEGVGIAAADIPHIFERFYRGDKSRSQIDTNGYGLGLSIAKEIVEAHSGSISVTSKQSKGSTFTIKLPIKNKP